MRYTDGVRQMLCWAALIGPLAIGACICGADHLLSSGLWIVLVAITAGLLYFLSCHTTTVDDSEAELERTPELRPQHPREAMMRYFMHECGGHPTLEQARDYIRSHLWWRPPYCIHKEVAHCQDCPCHRVVDEYRRGDLLIKTHEVKDCRGREPVETPAMTRCMLCAHCRPHKNDEFHDCEVPLKTANGDRPNGMDYYYPYYYPKQENECPHWKPSFSEARVERRWKHGHDGQLLSDIRFMDNGKKPREELEAELDEFIRISTPGSSESKKSYVPEWAAKEAKKNREKGMT